MGLTLGTNCGFVTEAPTDDPAESPYTQDSYTSATKDTSPADAATITEIGWYCSGSSEEANFEVGIYDDDSGPDNLLDGEDRTNAKGTTEGWKRCTGLNISISSSTAYWIAVQCDNTATSTGIDSANIGGSGAYSDSDGTTTLQDPFSNPLFGGPTAMRAEYALVGAAEEGGVSNVHVNIGDTWESPSEVLINIGDAWKSVTNAYVNVGDVWKTIY